jgi:hypothetical protein
VYNGTFAVGIRPQGAQVEIIFGADSILERPVSQRLLNRPAKDVTCVGSR